MSVHIQLTPKPGTPQPTPIHLEDGPDDTYSYRTSRSGTLYIARTRGGRTTHHALYLSGLWAEVSGDMRDVKELTRSAR